MNVQKNIKQLLLLAVAAVWLVGFSSCTTAQSAAKSKSELHPTPNTTAKKATTYHAIAQALTEQLPMKVDELTNLIKLEYNEEQHALIYTYLISGGVSEDMDAQAWTVVRKTVESVLREQVKTNQLLAQIRADGLTLVHIYKDKNNKELLTITLEHGTY